MKTTAKRFLLSLCVVLCLATAGWCINPFKVNEGGFGPKIKGLQLGMKLDGAEVGYEVAGIRFPNAVKNPSDYGASRIELNGEKRIVRLKFDRSNFGAGAMTVQEFLQAFINAYGIPRMEGERNGWSYRNLSEGWEVFCEEGGIVNVNPIITETNFN